MNPYDPDPRHVEELPWPVEPPETLDSGAVIGYVVGALLVAVAVAVGVAAYFGWLR